MIATPLADARWFAGDPTRPDGTQIAVLSGDPTKGAAAVYIKFKGRAPLHSHTSSYHGIVVQGSLKRWAKGQSEESAKLLGPGSYYFQPARRVHADLCLASECIIFLLWSGRMDSMDD